MQQIGSILTFETNLQNNQIPYHPSVLKEVAINSTAK